MAFAVVRKFNSLDTGQSRVGRELCEEVCRSQCPESSPELQHLMLPDANMPGELGSSLRDTELRRDEATS